MRLERLVNEQEARRILGAGEYGVLCMAAKDEPYGVPLNYCYVAEENALYFHCATKGTKLDCIRVNPRVSFVVTGNVRLVPEQFTTYYESAIVFGQASRVLDKEDMRKRLLQLCAALTPAHSMSDQALGKCMETVAVVRIDIERVSGKINRGE